MAAEYAAKVRLQDGTEVPFNDGTLSFYVNNQHQFDFSANQGTDMGFAMVIVQPKAITETDYNALTESTADPYAIYIVYPDGTDLG